jgi:Glycosyl transferases group 1
MLPPNSHNPEERRFVQELALHVTPIRYVRGIGIKGLRPHQLRSIPRRLAGGTGRDESVACGSLAILPFRTGRARTINAWWLRRQLIRLTDGRPDRWKLWTRFPSPELVDALESLHFARLVYEPIDAYAAAEDLTGAERDRLIQAEARLARRAMVITGGLGLAERFRMVPGGSHWLPFGHDLKRPRSSGGIGTTIGRPRLCVVGEFDWRMDEGLLASLAERRPEWQLVLAGPRRHPWGNRLARFANVHWLGQVPPDRVHAVVAGCEIALIPYRLTDWTNACLPVKVFDYLSEGTPVAATPLPELSLFSDVVRLVPPENFEAAIAEALQRSDGKLRANRRLAAKRFTLQDRARHAARLLQGEFALAPSA